jgi:hypothetical protein
MASGDETLNASGDVYLDGDGNVILNGYSGPPPATLTVTFSGMTMCCIDALFEWLQMTPDMNRSFVVTRTSYTCDQAVYSLTGISASYNIFSDPCTTLIANTRANDLQIVMLWSPVCGFPRQIELASTSGNTLFFGTKSDSHACGNNTPISNQVVCDGLTSNAFFGGGGIATVTP